MGILSRISRAIVPADHSISAEVLGTREVFSMITRAAWRYRRTMKYLLQRRGIKAFINFLYTKTFVPTGEGSGELAYYFIGPLIRRFPQIAPYPSYLEIEITTRCNKRCVLCEHTYWKEPSIDLSFEDFKKIVDQFPNLKWVNLTGEGDAFLNKDYLKMIEYLKKKDVMVYLVDSFDLIDERIAKKLVDMDVDGIYVSMDGATKETYERIKVGCDFEKVTKNIKKLIELKKAKDSPIPELCFRYVITTLNYHEMPKFVELVRTFGNRDDLGDGSKIHFVGLLVYPEIKQYYLLNVPEKIQIAAAKKKKEIVDGADVIFAHTEPKRLPSINRCLAWMEPYVMTAGGKPGYVLPCCAVLMSNNRDSLRKYAFGNLLEKPFKEIWNSERYRRFRYTVNKPDAKVPLLCRGCRAYDAMEREKKYGIDPTL
ncbi:MAG: radical SAM protein [Candidatus Heimdallarchaeota archaeon]